MARLNYQHDIFHIGKVKKLLVKMSQLVRSEPADVWEGSFFLSVKYYSVGNVKSKRQN